MAAKTALAKCCASIGNPDIDPCVPALIEAIASPEKTSVAIEQLLSTTFVANVDAATLAVLVPVLSRATRERSNPLKRKSAVIIVNMAKLVSSPGDIAPFLPRLLPDLERNAEDVSDPEIREICAAAHRILQEKAGALEAGATSGLSQRA